MTLLLTKSVSIRGVILIHIHFSPTVMWPFLDARRYDSSYQTAEVVSSYQTVFVVLILKKEHPNLPEQLLPNQGPPFCNIAHQLLLGFP